MILSDDEHSFAEFLVRAKVNTYASSQPSVRKLSDGASELEFQEGEFLYRDRYYGAILFHGQEVVFEDEVPRWSMVYYGYTPDGAEPVSEVIDLLKLALRNVPANAPYRGPAVLERGELSYRCRFTGQLGRFEGEEEVHRGAELLLRLTFAGGWIK